MIKAINYPLSLVYLLFGLVLISSVSYSSAGYSSTSDSSARDSSARDSPASYSEETANTSDSSDPSDAGAKESLSDKLSAIDKEAGSSGWKVRNGCLPANRIKRIKFVDDKTALITLFGKKTAILRLQTECPGIKRSGYVSYRSNSRLCARFDRLSVMGGSGYSCRIASIEPFVALEEPVLEKDFD